MSNLPKITRVYTEYDAEYLDEQIGSFAHTKDLFKLLVANDGYTSRSTKQIVFELYDVRPEDEPVSDPARDKDRRRTWAEGRFEKIRSGDASITVKEAAAFHAAFTKAFGNEWAAKVTPVELVTRPPRETILRCVADSMPFPDNPESAPMLLRLLAACQSGEPRPATIQLMDPDNLRLTRHKDGRSDGLEPTQKRQSIKAEQRYIIRVDRTAPETHEVLFFEFADEPLDGSSTNEQIGAIPFPHRAEMSQAYRYHDDGNPFSADEALGEYGFCAITYPKNWAFEQYFGVDPAAYRWTVEMFWQMVKKLRQALLVGEPVSIGLLDYVKAPAA